MATYYAWSNFPIERNEAGVTTKVIAVGDKVTQNDLGVSDDEWEQLVEVGAVRTDKYPDIPDHMAPAEYEKAQANQGIVEEMLMEVTEPEPEAVTPEAATASGTKK
jgi:hypothetical protein